VFPKALPRFHDFPLRYPCGPDVTLSRQSLRQISTIATIVAVAAALGAIYGLLVARSELAAHPDEMSEGAALALGALRGAVSGIAISFAVSLFEVVGLRSPPGRMLRQQPFLVHLFIKSLIYLVLIVVGLRLGQVLVPIMVEPGALRGPSWIQQIAISYLLSFLFISVLAINDLLGPGVLWRLLTGRYHRPRSEERVFLIMDLRGSTAIAERIGDHSFLSFLDAVFLDIGEPLLEQRGEIYKYVGDEIIATWPLERGCKDARCVRACFDAAARLDFYADAYRRLYGEVPGFRAALHAGRVVSGELGHVKREIAYLGDTLNTTARIEQVGKAQDLFCVISAPLLERLTLPPGITARPLGETLLSGKRSTLALYSLEREAGDVPKVSRAGPLAG